MKLALTLVPALATVAVVMNLAVVEQGQGTPSCQPKLVHCNYAHLYSGDLRVIAVDTVGESDHVVRENTEIRISVSNGVVTCNGESSEHERLGYKGTFHTERRGRGDIAGPGLLAVEFEFDNGRPVYKLTYACPSPRITRTSTDLNSGNSETENFPASPAAWNNAGLAVDPQPSTMTAMTTLVGQETTVREDPDNKAGGSTRTVWNLRRP